MADRPNGLASLNQARERARRTMPPPRYPARQLAAAPEQPDPDPVTPQQLPSVEPPRPPEPPVTPTQTAQPAPAVNPPVKLTFYVDEDMDRYLEEVRIHGLTDRPKVDISRSAVVRLALRRLREEMTAEQVKTLLAAQPTDTGRTGRKRR